MVKETNLYLIRHGETQYNVDGLYYGWTDCPINETGEAQAQRMGSFFQTIPVDVVLSSDLKRAQQTAQKIVQPKGLKLLTQPSLREIHFGAWEGKSFAYVKEHDPKHWRLWWEDWRHVEIPEGEAFSTFYERVTMGLESILNLYEGKDIVLVTHSGTMSVMLCYLLGMGEAGFWKFRPLHERYTHVSIQGRFPVMEGFNLKTQ